MSGFLDLFRRAPKPSPAEDYIRLEFDPLDPSRYRLVRNQRAEGSSETTETVLRPGEWEGPGLWL